MRYKMGSASIILFLLMLTIGALGLTGCVRPYPSGDAAASQPTPVIVVTQPFVPPPEVLATPDAGIPTPVPSESAEPTPVPIEPTAEPAAATTHVVQAGDTLFQIALQYGVSVEEIALANGLTDIDSLEIGQELIIPAPGATASAESTGSGEETSEGTAAATEAAPTAQPATAGGVHVVQPGENLFRISLRYGCTTEQMAQHNGISNPARIYVGQEIAIPDCN